MKRGEFLFNDGPVGARKKLRRTFGGDCWQCMARNMVLPIPLHRCALDQQELHIVYNDSPACGHSDLNSEANIEYSIYLACRYVLKSAFYRLDSQARLATRMMLKTVQIRTGPNSGMYERGGRHCELLPMLEEVFLDMQRHLEREMCFYWWILKHFPVGRDVQGLIKQFIMGGRNFEERFCEAKTTVIKSFNRHERCISHIYWNQVDQMAQ